MRPRTDTSLADRALPLGPLHTLAKEGLSAHGNTRLEHRTEQPSACLFKSLFKALDIRSAELSAGGG